MNKSDEKSAPEYAVHTTIQLLLLITMSVVATLGCVFMSAPFLPALTWATALAIMFSPLQQRLEKKLGKPNIAAALCVLLAALIVVIPASFVAQQLISEASNSAKSIHDLFVSGQWRDSVDAHPLVAPVLHWIERQFNVPGLVDSASAWLTSTAATLLQVSLHELVMLVLTFYLLFYFLRDRIKALVWLRTLSPLTSADMARMYGDVADTVNATLYGTLAVAIVQGTLGGLMFWWLDLPAPLLWGLVMALLAVIPVLGAFIIWIPAALFLLLTGNELQALVLILWGGIVVGGIDNLLYPILVGNRLKIHTVLAFISLVGGVMLFGTSGLVLGPLIFAVTRNLLQIWHRHNALIKDAA
ncbi:MAG: AI-2E family transporter [Gallionella sp.]|nr:AI-2E family transporter [Gallionella sp.]